jgi:hypothetical protein
MSWWEVWQKREKRQDQNRSPRKGRAFPRPKVHYHARPAWKSTINRAMGADRCPDRCPNRCRSPIVVIILVPILVDNDCDNDLVSEYSQSSSVLVARYRPPADENGRRERPTREEPHVQHLEKSEHRSEAGLNPESFSSPLACGASGRRCPTSREAPFLKLTMIGAGAKQSGQRKPFVLVVVLVLES